MSFSIITNSPPSATPHNLVSADAAGQYPFESVANHALSRIFEVVIENLQDASKFSLVSKRFHTLIFGDLSQALPLWKKLLALRFPRPQFTLIDGNCLEAYKKNLLFCRNLAKGNCTEQTITGYGGTRVMTANGLIYAESDDWSGGVMGILNPKTGRLQGALGGMVETKCLATGAEKMISGHEDGKIRISDLKTGTKEEGFIGHSSPVTSLVATDERIISTSESEGGIKVWDLKTRALVHTINTTPWLQAINENRMGMVNSLAVTDRKIIGGCSDAIRIWDLDTGTLLIENWDKITPGASSVSVFERKLFAMDASGFKIYDLETPRLEFEYVNDEYVDDENEDADEANLVAITMANGKIIGGKRGGEVIIWDLKTKAREKTMKFDFYIDSIVCVDGKLVIGNYYPIDDSDEFDYTTVILNFLAEPVVGIEEGPQPITQAPKRIKLDPQ